MSKEITLLNKGLFEQPFMDSKVKTRSVTTKEWVLGHLIGPLGLIFVVNTIAALVEKFFTQQTGAMYGTQNVDMIMAMGGKYEIVMTGARILAVLTGLLNGWLMQHTQSRQGRMRPWHLIFGFVSIAIGMLIFLFPGTTLGESYWYYFFFLIICYNTIGSSYFYLFRDTIVSISTRDPAAKAHLKFIRQMSWTLISGIIIGMMVNMVVLPMWLEHDITGYAKLMIPLSLIAIPLLLLEYYFTKERVIEDVAQDVGADKENNIPIREQMKALFSNKYFIILTILATIGGIMDNFKGGNVQYFYIKFLLGGADNWAMYTIYQVVAGVPLGIGAFLVYPLAKRIGIKNLSVAGFALALIGNIIGLLFASHVHVVIAAGFLKNLGLLPHAYITATLMCYAYDSVEHRSGLRLEGLMGVAIIVAVQHLIYAPFAGGFESTILKLGFVDVAGVVPSAEVTRFMTIAFYAFDIAMCAAYVILLPFVDVEKHLPQINADLLARRKAVCEAKGEVWVDPVEAERLEHEQRVAEAEENRIADLKEKCAKKGLDFDTENRKYLAKKAAKEAKKKK